MIPKIIHYCWFGRNPKPELAMKCIASWKKYCPDYRIVEWNEDNFDLSYNDYVREAYENRKWAFITDVVRLKVLFDMGGIYMDTDVEVVKNIDSLLNYEAVSGFESEERIPTGLIAAEKGNPMIGELLRDYDDAHFVREDGSLNLETNVTRITNACLKYGLIQNNSKQTINTFTFLPKDYLCPKDLDTREIHITENTLCIHHFDGSWHSEEDRYVERIQKKWAKIPGISYIAKFVGIVKYRGMRNALKEATGWIARRK